MSRKTKAFPTALFPESDNRPPLSFGTRGTAIFGHDILTPGANAIVFQQDRRSDRLIPISPPRKCAPRTRMWKLPPDESSINLFVEESMRYFESNYPETDIPRQLMKPLLREGARIEFIDYSTPPFADNQMILYRTELQPQGYVAFAGGAVMNELYFMNRASIGPTTQCVFTPTATFKTPINQISESSQANLLALRLRNVVSYCRVSENPVCENDDGADLHSESYPRSSPRVTVDVISNAPYQCDPVCVDMNPHILSESAILLNDGSIALWNLDRLSHQSIRVRKVSPEDNYICCEYLAHPKTIMLTTSKGLETVDFRESSVCMKFAQCASGDDNVIGARVRPDMRFQAALASRKSICLYDLRHTSQPLLRWGFQRSDDTIGGLSFVTTPHGSALPNDTAILVAWTRHRSDILAHYFSESSLRTSSNQGLGLSQSDTVIPPRSVRPPQLLSPYHLCPQAGRALDLLYPSTNFGDFPTKDGKHRFVRLKDEKYLQSLGVRPLRTSLTSHPPLVSLLADYNPGVQSSNSLAQSDGTIHLFQMSWDGAIYSQSYRYEATMVNNAPLGSLVRVTNFEANEVEEQDSNMEEDFHIDPYAHNDDDAEQTVKLWISNERTGDAFQETERRNFLKEENGVAFPFTAHDIFDMTPVWNLVRQQLGSSDFNFRNYSHHQGITNSSTSYDLERSNVPPVAKWEAGDVPKLSVKVPKIGGGIANNQTVTTFSIAECSVLHESLRSIATDNTQAERRLADRYTNVANEPAARNSAFPTSDPAFPSKVNAVSLGRTARLLAASTDVAWFNRRWETLEEEADDAISVFSHESLPSSQHSGIDSDGGNSFVSNVSGRSGRRRRQPLGKRTKLSTVYHKRAAKGMRTWAYKLRRLTDSSGTTTPASDSVPSQPPPGRLYSVSNGPTDEERFELTSFASHLRNLFHESGKSSVLSQPVPDIPTKRRRRRSMSSGGSIIDYSSGYSTEMDGTVRTDEDQSDSGDDEEDMLTEEEHEAELLWAMRASQASEAAVVGREVEEEVEEDPFWDSIFGGGSVGVSQGIATVLSSSRSRESMNGGVSASQPVWLSSSSSADGGTSDLLRSFSQPVLGDRGLMNVDGLQLHNSFAGMSNVRGAASQSQKKKRKSGF